MAKVKIKDLPKNMSVKEDEMKKIRGGFSLNILQSYGSYNPLKTNAFISRDAFIGINMR